MRREMGRNRKGISGTNAESVCICVSMVDTQCFCCRKSESMEVVCG